MEQAALSERMGCDCSKITNLSLSDELANPGKVNLVGGHVNQIQIESEDVICKKTKINEALQY